jgi:hypothetical protein
MRDTHFHLCKKLKTASPVRMMRGNQAWGVKVMLTLIMLSSIILLFSISGENLSMTSFCAFDQAKQ